MKLARLLVWEVRSLVRRIMPWTALRRGVAVTILVVMGLATVMIALVPVKGVHAPAPSVGMLAGFLAMSLGMAMAAALAAGAALLHDAEHARLYQLAPASDLVRAFVPLGALGIFGAAASAVFAAPLMAVAVRSALGAAAVMLAAGALAVAWSLLLTAGVLTLCARWLGRENGARVATLLSMSLTLGMLWGFGFVVRLSTSAAAITFGLVAAIVALPPSALFIAARFLAALQVTGSSRISPEPAWGRPSWGRLVARTNTPWMVAGLIPSALLLATPLMPFRWTMAAFLAVTAAMSPLANLCDAEYAFPDRWRLAPEAGGVRRSLFLAVGGTTCLVTAAAVIAIGWRHPQWAMATVVLLIVTPLSFLFQTRFVRTVVQAAVLVAALLTGALS